MANFNVQTPQWAGYDPLDAATASMFNQTYGGTNAAPWLFNSYSDRRAAATDRYRGDLARTNALLMQQHRDDMQQQLAQGAMSNLAKLGYDITGIPMLAQILGPRGVLTGMESANIARAVQGAEAVKSAGAGYKDFAEAGMYPNVLPDWLTPRLGITGKEGPALALAKGGGGGKSDEGTDITEGAYTVKLKRNPGESDDSYAARQQAARARVRQQSEAFGDVSGGSSVPRSFGVRPTPQSGSVPMTLDQYNKTVQAARQGGGKVEDLGGGRSRITGKDGSSTVIQVR